MRAVPSNRPHFQGDIEVRTMTSVIHTKVLEGRLKGGRKEPASLSLAMGMSHRNRNASQRVFQPWKKSNLTLTFSDSLLNAGKEMHTEKDTKLPGKRGGPLFRGLGF